MTLFEDKELKLIRENWEESIKKTLVANGEEDIDREWLDAELISHEKLEW